MPCVPLCGDGIVTGSEQCDLGALNGTHQGCTTNCMLDSLCGDGIIDNREACDDGNTVSGDGCAANCSGIEPGWVCNAGESCRSVCGDGVVAGGEECDLGRQNGTLNCALDCTFLSLP
jgi:cysteine-rich repeat protein